jgi:hypothetical protein
LLLIKLGANDIHHRYNDNLYIFYVVL